MKDKRIKELRSELKYLLDVEIEKEINNYSEKINDESYEIKKLAEEIYLKRGLNLDKIKSKNAFKNIISLFDELLLIFDNNQGKKKQMIIEIIYTIVLLILLKIPFNLIRDVGYEYIDIFSSNLLFTKIWNILFVILYTITIICGFITFIKNFVKKYK